MQIPFSALDQQHEKLLPELMNSIEHVLKSGGFILGSIVEDFEQKFSSYHNRKYAVGVASGTDAIILALKALGIGDGDEVITTPNTFITTVSSIALVGAKPVLVDIGSDDNIDVEKIEQAITPKTKAIIPVHWTGRPCDMGKICSIAKRHNIKIIEDCAQAIAAKFKTQLVGTFGEVGCFSLHPFKTLNACGDAGIVLTDDIDLYRRLKALRQNGLSPEGACDYWSSNSRLDALQAAILNVKWSYFEEWTKRRIEIANYYSTQLKAVQELTLPSSGDKDAHPVFHTYIIKTEQRDALRNYLKTKGIETRVHYEVPVHKQPIAIRTLGCKEGALPNADFISSRVLSLPIYAELQQSQLDYIINQIKSFYETNRGDN